MATYARRSFEGSIRGRGFDSRRLHYDGPGQEIGRARFRWAPEVERREANPPGFSVAEDRERVRAEGRTWRRSTRSRSPETTEDPCGAGTGGHSRRLHYDGPGQEIGRARFRWAPEVERREANPPGFSVAGDR